MRALFMCEPENFASDCSVTPTMVATVSELLLSISEVGYHLKEKEKSMLQVF